MNRGTRWIIVWVCIAVILAAGDVGFYAHRFCHPQFCTLSQDTETWGQFGEFVGGTLGPLFALLAFLGLLWQLRDQRIQNASKVYLEQARELWTQSYDIFSDAADHTNYDSRDSQRWNTTAHLLRAAAALEQSIADEAHRRSYEAYRAITRHLFFELLRIETGESFPLEYFRTSPGDHGRRNASSYPPSEDVVLALYHFALASKTGAELSLDGEFPIWELRSWHRANFLPNLIAYVQELHHGQLDI